ncbi:MAG: 50S ribosomal protein L30 [Treponema sp.]|jgi:large subunit ribosomal protein L30|nr:50S ribosomal protein L30 [Treponema sp.]
MAGKIRIRLVRSLIGSLPKQRATVRSLGLRKIGSVIEQEATPAILGMVRVVSHLVSVEDVPGA